MPEVELPSNVSASATAPSGDSTAPTILVIDDEAAIRE